MCLTHCDLPLPVCGSGCLLSGAKAGGDMPSAGTKKISGVVRSEISFGGSKEGCVPYMPALLFLPLFFFTGSSSGVSSDSPIGSL